MPAHRHLKSLVVAVVVTLLPATAHAQASAGDAALQLVREACLGTGMQKDAFERLGRDRRWRRVPAPSPRPGAWHVRFQGPGALVTLSTIPHLPGDPQVDGAACTIITDGVGDDWVPAVEGLAVELGLGNSQTLPQSGSREAQVWSDVPGGQTLTATYAPGQRIFTITYVKRVPAPAA